MTGNEFKGKHTKHSKQETTNNEPIQLSALGPEDVD